MQIVPPSYSVKRQLRFNVLVGVLLLAVPCAVQAAQDTSRDNPRLAWKRAQQFFAQAKIKIKQRHLTEVITLLSRGRWQLEAIRRQWPAYRRLQIRRAIRDAQRQKASLYRLVRQQGLVEYHGRFYSFDQMLQILEFQQSRALKWMELLKAREEVRRVRTERMVEQESRREVQERQLQQEKIVREQARFQREWKRIQEENRRNQMERMLKEQQRQRAREQEERQRRQNP